MSCTTGKAACGYAAFLYVFKKQAYFKERKIYWTAKGAESLWR